MKSPPRRHPSSLFWTDQAALGDDLQAFIKQDEAFHDELVKLLKASKAGDLPATTKQLGVVLEGCTACHSKYRF